MLLGMFAGLTVQAQESLGDRARKIRVQKENAEAAKCNMIVCWTHNWPECPLEVVELKTAISDQLSAVSKGQKLCRR